MHTHIKHIYIREPTVHADNYARVPRLDARALERCKCYVQWSMLMAVGVRASAMHLETLTLAVAILSSWHYAMAIDMLPLISIDR